MNKKNGTVFVVHVLQLEVYSYEIEDGMHFIVKCKKNKKMI
jgi:hypothetical protein